MFDQHSFPKITLFISYCHKFSLPYLANLFTLPFSSCIHSLNILTNHSISLQFHNSFASIIIPIFVITPFAFFNSKTFSCFFQKSTSASFFASLILYLSHVSSFLYSARNFQTTLFFPFQLSCDSHQWIQFIIPLLFLIEFLQMHLCVQVDKLYSSIGST